jgi:inner membrane protein
LITDLRMGQEPNYSFSFAIAYRDSSPVALAQPEHMRMAFDIRRSLNWLLRRALGEQLPPPR